MLAHAVRRLMPMTRSWSSARPSRFEACSIATVTTRWSGALPGNRALQYPSTSQEAMIGATSRGTSTPSRGSGVSQAGRPVLTRVR
jgi:hypothetical protein